MYYSVISALAISIAFKFSKKARYYIKYTFFLCGCVGVTIPFVPFMLFRPKDYRNAFMPARGCILLGRLCGVKFELRGLEHVDKSKGAVILCNHQSSLDIIVCSYLSLSVGRFATVVKKSVAYVFPLPWLWGTIFLDRNNKSAGRNFISKESEEIRQKNTKIFIYPEGTRHQGSELLPFKKGAFHIALNVNCDIIPVVASPYYFIDYKEYKFDGGRAIIEILPAISTKGMNTNDIDNLIKKTRDIMQKKYEELSKEVMKIN